MNRRPAALVAQPVARLVGYTLLAGLGALQWIRYIDGAGTGRAYLWVLAGLATAVLILFAGRLPGWWATFGLAGATLFGLFLAACASGIDLHYLKPAHWDELGDGLVRGTEALNTVRLPYAGKDPWVIAAVEVAGALLCWGAGVFATWPESNRAARGGSLVLLLVLAASPIVSIGAEREVLLGLAIAVLVAIFLWLERLSRRPGLGIAVVAGAALLVAVPLGQAADREDPWFDYKEFSEKLGGGPPVTFDWNHEYGPIDWPREGAELFRVRSDEPHYWKAQTLSYFDGVEWSSSLRVDPGGDEPRDDLPRSGRQHPDWNVRFSVALRRLETPEVIGAGTILNVTDATDDVVPAVVPGQWVAEGGDELSKGDSYTIEARVPQPTPEELEEATVGGDPRRYGALTLHLDLRPEAEVSFRSGLPLDFAGNPILPDDADLTFAPFEAETPPLALYPDFGINGRGSEALGASYYERTWALAKSLRREHATPYAYTLAVNDYLRGADFVYTEKPRTTADEAPLETFLFDTKAGYCQQYSGAMVLLLRMGGVPARVATGFSPGGVRTGTNEWVVRDTDAHSWVEVWFDEIGWVTFDPTPPETPARSQIAAIAAPDNPDAPGIGGDVASGSNAFERPGALLGPGGVPLGPDGLPLAGSDDGGLPVWALVMLGIVGVVALGFAANTLRHSLRFETAETALAELERALRRSGRAAPTGTTLTQLEQRLGVSGGGYLRALRAARYSPRQTPPDPALRAAFRRDLATGLGFGGRLRALWALPPRVNLRRGEPR